MRESAFLLLLFIYISLSIAHEPPDSIWCSFFNGAEDDEENFVCRLDDGGYIIAGTTRSYGAGSSDVLLLKLNADGEQQWFRTFGASGGDEGQCVQITDNGGFIIAGCTQSDTNTQGYLIKADSAGNSIWERVWGGGGDTYLNCVQQTDDGGYVVAGTILPYGAEYEDVYLAKTNASGFVQWSQTYSNYYWDFGECVQQTADGGYIIIGESASQAQWYDVYVVKTDSQGNEQWDRTFGTATYEIGYWGEPTQANGFIIAGYEGIISGLLLIKIDFAGNLEWYNSYSGLGVAQGYFVKPTYDGGYIACGESGEYIGSEYYVFILKTDEEGEVDWQGFYNAGSNCSGSGLDLSSDGSCIVVGSYYENYNSGGFALKLQSTSLANMIQDLTVTIDNDNLLLDWSEVYGATGYNIYRGTEPYFSISGSDPIGFTTASEYVDTNAVNGNYFYRVTFEY